MKQYVLENRVMIKDKLYSLVHLEDDTINDEVYYLELACIPVGGGLNQYNVMIMFDINRDNSITAYHYGIQVFEFDDEGNCTCNYERYNLDQYLEGANSSIDKIKSYLHKCGQSEWLLRNAKHKGKDKGLEHYG